MPSYYDIDTILAEEELLTVKPSFAFYHLSHLDPDLQHAAGRKRRRDGDSSIEDNNNANANHVLPEGSKIKVPLWAADRWAILGHVKIMSLPRHYRDRMKERLAADSVEMNLCKKNEHYFLTGILVTNLLLRTAHITKRHKARSSSSNNPASDNNTMLLIQALSTQAYTLQNTLLSTMMGDRLCRNFNWTLSALDAMEDDVSDWIGRLTTLERSMFVKGVGASDAVMVWREFGCGRLGVCSLAVSRQGNNGGRGMNTVENGNAPGGNNGKGEKMKKRAVTPV